MLLEAMRKDFGGLSTECDTAQGWLMPRHYLDSAALTLMMGVAQEVARLLVILLDHSRIMKKLAVATLFCLATTTFSALLRFPSVEMGYLRDDIAGLAVAGSLQVVNHLFFGIGLHLGSEAWLLASRRRIPWMQEAS